MSVMVKTPKRVKLSPPTRISKVRVKAEYFTVNDIVRFKEGTHFGLYDKMGAHVMTHEGKGGAYFAAWAPNARQVAVIGDFNGWNGKTHPLRPRTDGSGIWEGFIAGIKRGDLYKFSITPKYNGRTLEKADPFAFYCETPPKTASIVYAPEYSWNDGAWMTKRGQGEFAAQPISVYEVHLGSWRKNGRAEFQTYRQMAKVLVPYVKKMGFSHVELMPLMEHPFYGSWGYQALGYFAPTSRYGKPEDLMYLIDQFHQAGIGVILDWVVSHFPNDEYGLANFDGTKLYEQDALHPDWQSCIFNIGRYEVNEFLISSAVYWLENYHIDGLRVDAVASMLYLDYSKKDGEWSPNIFGGRENLEAVAFIRRLNETVNNLYPAVHMIAEESTAWPDVTRPCTAGGLGFHMKWNMGWMHDTLRYFQRDPNDRGHYRDEIAFCLYYAFSENFLLSLSHDEVVYQKNSLISKMPGDDKEKFANLRTLFAYMYAHPGKKLLFMGGEFAQWDEWGHDAQLKWELARYDRHQQIQQFVKDLNGLYAGEPALYEQDFLSRGFEWLDMGHGQDAIFTFLRKGLHPKDCILIVCNFNNKTYKDYTIGIPTGGVWAELLNSDDKRYGGEGRTNPRGVVAKAQAWDVRKIRYQMGSSHHVRDFTLTINLPPLSVAYFKGHE